MANFSKLLTVNDQYKLVDYPTSMEGKIDAQNAKIKLKKLRKKIAKLQDKMYAHDKYNVLICLQGMDTSGKDSLIREVFKAVNVRGVVVESFKTPSEKELQHDYLWRHQIKLPEKGKITVFNRTHYENVLVTRVHPEYLINENIPKVTDPTDLPKDFWKKRFKQINNFEKNITDNGMIVIKFYLNISKSEQKNRLLSRLEEDDKNWKFSVGDLEERALWDTYMDCYQEAIQNTNTSYAPWYVIPSDDKTISRYLVAKIIYEKLNQYQDIQYPEMPEEQRDQKLKYKEQLEAE